VISFTFKDLYDSPVAQKIELAYQLFRNFGSRLQEPQNLGTRLARLAFLQQRVSSRMKQGDMPATCYSCATASATGGCCSIGMSNENDAVQLLINLLAGESVEISCDDGKECSFLGKSGCSLRYKPYFCLNYFCDRFRHRLEPSLLRPLLLSIGQLLQEQYAMEQYLLRTIFSKPVEK
jgi:hypothetical protein